MATANLQVRITAELGQIRAALAGLQQQLNTAKKTGGEVGSSASQGIAQLNGRLASTGRIVAGIAASLGAGMSIAGLVRASDEAATIVARLKLATKTSEQFAAAQRGVYEIAQRTRTSLLASVELYGRIERSTRDIGLNQATILQLTETINQAAQISGGGAGAEAALFQLSQGLASGVLRGEELNSVLEQAPRLAQAIADGMEIPIGKLREIAKEGELTSGAVLRALLSQSQTLQKEFASFPPTIASGFTAIRNAFVQYLQTSAEAGGAARTFAEALQAIARNIPFLIEAFIRLGSVVGAYLLFFKVLPGIYTVMIGLTGLLAGANVGLAASFAAVGTTGGKVLLGLRVAAGLLIAAFAGWQIGKLLSKQFVEVEVAGIRLFGYLLKMGIATRGAFRLLGQAIREAFVGAFNFVIDRAVGFYAALARGAANIPGVGKEAAALFGGVAENLRKSRLESDGLGTAMDRLKNSAIQTQKEIADANAELADMVSGAYTRRGAKDEAAGPDGDIAIPGAGTAGGKGKKASGEAAKLAQIQAELIADAARRALAALEQLYEDAKIPMREYFAEKGRLETVAVDAALEAARAERAAAEDAGGVAAAQAKIVQLLRDRAEIGPRAAREQKKAEEELTRELGALQIRLMTAQGETGAAARAQLEEEFLQLKRRLLREGDTFGYELANKVINAEAFGAELSEVERRVQEALSRFSAVQSATGAQVEAGMMGMGDGEERVQQQREKSLEQLVQARDRYMEIAANARLANDIMSEAKALEAIEALNGEIATLSINTESLGYKATQVLQGALTTLFTDLASGTKSASDALKDFVRNFAQGMAQIAANALATYLVLQLLDAIYPGLGKTTAAMMGANVKHTGGIAGSGGTTRQLPAFMFAGAPRYHSGGIAGLAPDEVPAVLKRGEEVITQQDERHRNNAGRDGRAIVKTPIVAIGDRAVADAMAGAAGEDIVVTHVMNNLEKINRGGG